MNRNRRLLHRILAVFCASVFLSASLFTLMTSAADSSYSDATTAAYEAEIERLRHEQEELESTLSSIRGDQSRAAEYGEYLSKQISLTSDKIKVTQELISELNQKIEQKKEEIEQESENIERTYANFLNQIRISYEEADNSVLSVLLDSDGLADLLSRVERLSSLLDYDKRLKQKYEESKASLVAAKAVLEDSLAKQQKYSEELNADIQNNERLLAENEDYLNTLAMNEEHARNLLDQQIKEREKLDRELEEYIQEMIRLSEEQYDGGLLSWPLPKENYVGTGRYGYGTLWAYGVLQVRYHNGVDLRASTGTDVYSAASGTVQIATYNSTYGYYVLVDHGGGVSTLYAHLSQLLVSPGQKVARGERIALSGNTGYSFGAHLHFEVRVDGVRVDPINDTVLMIPSNFYFLPDA